MKPARPQSPLDAAIAASVARGFLDFSLRTIPLSRPWLTVREAATAMGRVNPETGAVNTKFIKRLIDEGKLVADRDKPIKGRKPGAEGKKNSPRISAVSVRIYIARYLTATGEAMRDQLLQLVADCADELILEDVEKVAAAVSRLKARRIAERPLEP